MKEFINICQGGVSVRDYSLKFNKLSKYAPSLVSNPRDKMSHFLTGVFKVLVEEYRLSMLHAQQVEYRRLNTMSREAKKAISYEGCSSKGRLDIYDNPRFKKSFLILFLKYFQRLVIIGCPTLSFKREHILSHQDRSQLVESVAGTIIVISLFG